jgi:hypothetical protein
MFEDALFPFRKIERNSPPGDFDMIQFEIARAQETDAKLRPFAAKAHLEKES